MPDERALRPYDSLLRLTHHLRRHQPQRHADRTKLPDGHRLAAAKDVAKASQLHLRLAGELPKAQRALSQLIVEPRGDQGVGIVGSKRIAHAQMFAHANKRSNELGNVRNKDRHSTQTFAVTNI